MSELNIKEFYEITGSAGYERATSIAPRLWPFKKIAYGYNSSDNTVTVGERNYIVLYGQDDKPFVWWVGYQRKLKFVLSDGQVVIIDGSKSTYGVVGYDERAEPIKDMMKFIDEFNAGFVGNLYNMEDDTFEDI